MRDCGHAASFIQKHFRGLLVRTVLGDKAGRELHKKFKHQLIEMQAKKKDMSESAYVAKASAFMGRVRTHLHQQRVKNIDMRRMQSYSLRSSLRKAADKEKKLKMKGAIQPVRTSVFEPMAIALRNLEPTTVKFDKSSRVMVQVLAEKKNLDRKMPQEATNKPHSAARRGRAAIYARRIAKKPKEETQVTTTKLVDIDMFDSWALKQFTVKQ